MAEKKPEYTLEFVLTYEVCGKKAITFTGSSDDPEIILLASNEIKNLNSSMMGSRIYQITTEVYKNSLSLSKNGLLQEVKRYLDSKKAAEIK